MLRRVSDGIVSEAILRHALERSSDPTRAGRTMSTVRREEPFLHEMMTTGMNKILEELRETGAPPWVIEHVGKILKMLNARLYVALKRGYAELWKEIPALDPNTSPDGEAPGSTEAR